MFCNHCGKEVNDNAAFCIHCGRQLSGNNPAPTNSNDFDDSSGKGLAVLCFFIPLVGLILYLIYQKDRPILAKAVGKGAIAGFIVRVTLAVIITILYLIICIAAFGGLIYMTGAL